MKRNHAVSFAVLLSLVAALTLSSQAVSGAAVTVELPDASNPFAASVVGVAPAGTLTAHAGASNVFVEWSPVPGAEAYRTRHRVAGRVWRAWVTSTSAAVSRNVTGLARSTAHEVEFQVRVAGVWSATSALGVRTRPASTVAPVKTVTAEATVDRLMVAWSGGQVGTQFRVAVSRNGGPEELIAVTYRSGLALELAHEPGDSLVFAVGARVEGVWGPAWVRSTPYAVPTAGHTHHEGQWVPATEETAEYAEVRVPTRYAVFDPTPMNDPTWGITRMGFLVNCPSVRFAAVDPIVSPGVDRTAHLHEFFGNPEVTPHTTTQQLADVPSAAIGCSDRNDKSGYWSPAVYQDGRRVTATGMSIYYKSPTGFEQPIPFGLRVVAGDAAATGNQGSHIGWWEADAKVVLSAERDTMIARSDRSPIALRINFPQCWDGVHLDSPDHRSHLAYSVDTARHDNHFVGTPLSPEDGNGCPASHPVRIPQVTTFTRYDVAGGEGLRLSSGPWYTFHQDFWNGWAPEQMAELSALCGAVQRHMCRISPSSDLQAMGQFMVTVPA